MSGVDFLTSFFCSLEMKFLSGVVLLLALSGVTHGQENDPVMLSVKEGRDAILPCSLVGTNIESKLFDWRKVGQTDKLKKEVFMYDAGDHYNNGLNGQNPQFKGRVSHFQDELKHGNASILITKTKVADSGDYTCVFLEPSQSPQPIQTSHIKLLVVGASPKPSITTLHQTDVKALLKCEVLGASPRPIVQWKDSEGKVIPAKEPQVTDRGGRYDVILQATVTKTDRYSCVSTQEEINYQTDTETFVYINGASPKPYVSTLYQTKDWALLKCEVLGANPKPKVQWQDSEGNIIPAKEPQVTYKAGRRDVTLQATVTKTDSYRCVVTEEGIPYQTEAETFVFINDCSTEMVTIRWLAASAGIFVMCIAVLIALLVLLRMGASQYN